MPVSREFELARSYLDTLLETERTSEGDLNAYQGELLTALCRHAAANIPFYGKRPIPLGRVDPRSSDWTDQPFMSRSDLARYFADLRAPKLPEGHGVSMAVQTGGSTGNPARRDLSSLESLARIVSTYRMFLDWDMDMARPLFMLRRPQIGSDRDVGPGYRRWGFPWLPEETLGRRWYFDIDLPPAEQLARLAEEAPVYVNTLPSNILRLAVEARRSGVQPSIPIIISVAEFLPPEVKAVAGEVFGSRLINILSSAEGGVIAIECPQSDLLHIQSEQVLVEIIGDDGRPCNSGEVGEVVITPLYNYATPLIRYRTGDYVERGPACPCGRTLPTIAKIVGRREHMFRFPDGRRALPSIDRVKVSELLGHEAWVLAQTGPKDAEMRVAGDIDRSRETALEALAEAATDGAFSVTIRRVESQPLTSGGKRHFCINEIG